jgi:hypothetical protein
MPNEAKVVTASAYSRAHPSERYRQLLSLYQQMHTGGEKPQEMFAGISLAPQAGRIATLIKHTGATTLLDYGCGKARLYNNQVNVDGKVYVSIVDVWGLKQVTLYDPAYPPYIALPQGKFDGVICTDVLEHCPQEDMEWILGELFSYANHFVFANIAAYPAMKTLPNGENAHCTIQPLAWWKSLIDRVAEPYPQVQFQFIVTESGGTCEAPQRIEHTIERIFKR